MKRFLLSFQFALILAFSQAQVKVSEAEILLQSRHLWRGSQLGKGLSIEPSMTISTENFSMNFWAALTPNKSYSEIDLIPSWSFKHYSLTLFDYYNPAVGLNNQYLNFKKGLNRHSVEITLDNYSVENVRIKWLAGTFLFGDKNEITGKPLYSTYFEFKLPFKIFSIDADPYVGLTPFKGYYADKFAIINAGICLKKEIDLNLPFTIPLSLAFISNPYSKSNFIHFSGGISF